MKRVALPVLAGLLVGGSAIAAPTVLAVRPSAVDPGVKAFDDPSIVVLPEQSGPATPLVVFLPGTNGRPQNVQELLGVVAGQGYRAIGLEYDDEPAVSQVCPRDPDPRCSADFRQMRVYGDGPSKAVSNPRAEAVEVRLTGLLQVLARQRPQEGWDSYLKDDRPDWSRIVVSGLSQGAGMAAYIAKHSLVKRVVLFSSPWDFTGSDRRPAPWLSEPSATPPDRWYAEYHRRELTADKLRAAYAALAIPADHIHVFNLDIPNRFAGAERSPNPYHGLTVRDVGYADEWRWLYGRADTP